MLTFCTQLLHWRREQIALRDGRLTLLPSDPQVLAFTREHERQSLLCVFNFSDRPARLVLPEAWRCASVLGGSGLDGARIESESVHCEAFGGLFLHKG